MITSSLSAERPFASVPHRVSPAAPDGTATAQALDRRAIGRGVGVAGGSFRWYFLDVEVRLDDIQAR
jgi:hypothetical protein